MKTPLIMLPITERKEGCDRFPSLNSHVHVSRLEVTPPGPVVWSNVSCSLLSLGYHVGMTVAMSIKAKCCCRRSAASSLSRHVLTTSFFHRITEEPVSNSWQPDIVCASEKHCTDTRVLQAAHGSGRTKQSTCHSDLLPSSDHLKPWEEHFHYLGVQAKHTKTFYCFQLYCQTRALILNDSAQPRITQGRHLLLHLLPM